MSKHSNGGTTLYLGDYELTLLNGYTASWETETEDTFENWDYTEVEIVKGRRFSLKAEVKNLSADDKDELMNVLYGRVFTLTCPDYTGEVKVTSASQVKMQSSNHLGTYYTVNFTATATELVGGSGSL